MKGSEWPPLERHNEPPLTEKEQELLSVYKTLHQNSLPDNKNIRYKLEHAQKVRDLDIQFGDPTERSILFDRMVFAHKRWWGEHVEAYRSAKYDDYVNGADLILEFLSEENERLGLLALDTSICNTETLGEKYNKIYNKIEKGELGTLEYGPTLDGSLEGEEFAHYKDIPQAVLVISPQTLEWYASNEVTDETLQAIALWEVRNQLSEQKFYIENLPQLSATRKQELIEKIESILNIIEVQIEDKKIPPVDPGVRDAIVPYATDPIQMQKICPRLKVPYSSSGTR